MPPSLYNVGEVVPQKYMSNTTKRKAKNMRAIDFLMDFIDERVPKRRGEYPTIRARGIGDKVILLKSGTGSGKSSAFPAELFYRFFDRTNKEIVVTQPSVFNAIDVSTQITKYYSKIQFGTTIAYQTGPMKKSKSSKGITFMTVKILQNMLQGGNNEQFARKNSFVIIDEVHTRSKAIDSVLFLIKKFLEEMWDNPACPIFVLASATFDKRIFMEYFNVPAHNYLEVGGMSFPITDHFIEYNINDYLKYAAHKIKDIHLNNLDDISPSNTMRDIILFVAGESQSKEIKKQLDSFNTDLLVKGYEDIKKSHDVIDTRKVFEYLGGSSTPYLAPIVLNSTTFNKIGKEFKDLNALVSSINIEVFDPGTKEKKKVIPVRKVFIATPFAETGVTIETLKYCVDTGWVNNPEFNQDFNATVMKLCNVTNGMATQRRGRVGRKAPGIFYSCYTKKTFDSFIIDDYSNLIKEEASDLVLTFIIKETKAEIVTIDEPNDKTLPGTFYKKHYMSDKDWYGVKTSKPFNVAAMDMLEPPMGSGIQLSLEKLYALGFIDYKYDATVLGVLANKISRLNIEPLKVILSGYAYNAYILDLITIIAFTEVGAHKFLGRGYKKRNPLKLPDREAVFYNSVVIADDFVDYLFIWYEFMEQLDKISKKISLSGIEKIEKWCEDNDINYRGFMVVHKVRNDLMENFIQNGFDIFRNGLKLPRGTYSLVNILKNNLSDGIREIVKIKKCLLEGFRFNLATWNHNDNRYILMHKRIPVKVDNDLVKMLIDSKKIKQPRPKIILTNGVLLKQNKMTGASEFHTSAISILDGFVDVDHRFLF